MSDMQFTRRRSSHHIAQCVVAKAYFADTYETSLGRHRLENGVKGGTVEGYKVAHETL